MGTIYAAPKEIQAPEFRSGEDIDDYFKRGDAYVEAVKKWAKDHGDSPESGEEVDFPAGDGYARYVVLSLKPVKLLHLNVGDAWQVPYAKRLTAADVREAISAKKALAELFGRKGQPC